MRKTKIKQMCARTFLDQTEEPIPKWINIELTADCLPTTPNPPLCPNPPIEEPLNRVILQRKDLIPMSDLAMILCNKLDGAISKGLFDLNDTT